MDTETIEVIAGLRGDIHQVEARLTTRIDRLDARLGGLDQRLGGLDECQERRFEETRRHFDVIAESLRDDIRMIAEGLLALSEKFDTFRR